MMFLGFVVVMNLNFEYYENMIVFVFLIVQECVLKVEILLVLDVFGLMGSLNCIQNLCIVVIEFVDIVLVEDNIDMINVLLVFYLEYVSMGDDLFGVLLIDQIYSYMVNCIEFEFGDFYNIVIDFDYEYEQV